MSRVRTKHIGTKENIIKHHNWNQLLRLSEEAGYDIAIPYAFYLADNDVEHEAFACEYVYMLVDDFYKTWGLEMPQNTFNMLFPYLQRAAEANDPAALDDMAILYKEGKYVTKDTSLFEEYSKRAFDAWKE